jgi:hypothetical protein
LSILKSEALARQTTVRDQETPELARGAIDTFTHPLHGVDTLSAALYYRKGAEFAEPVKSGGHRQSADDPQLNTYGDGRPAIRSSDYAVGCRAE